MEVLYILIPLALAFAAGGLVVFFKAVSQGQFDDLETPAHRILLDEEKIEADDTLPRE